MKRAKEDCRLVDLEVRVGDSDEDEDEEDEEDQGTSA